MLAGNSVNAHDASESLNVSVEREKDGRRHRCTRQAMNFRRAYRICRYEKAVPDAVRSIGEADRQRHFLSLVSHVVRH